MPDNRLAFFRSETLSCLFSSISSIGITPVIYPYLFSFFSLQYTRHTSSCMFVGFPCSPPVTYLCKLLGIRAVAACLQLELFRV